MDTSSSYDSVGPRLTGDIILKGTEHDTPSSIGDFVMRPCIVLTALFLSCSTMQIVAADNLIKPGHNINDVSKVMQESGYQETRLDMAPPNKDTDMKMWTVDEVDKGVMIVAFTTKDKKVLDISYFLCDERPKGSRKNFYFHVTEFYPKTREMQIRLPNKADSDSGK